MIRNPISKVAVVSILVGALLPAGPSFGFSSFAADRALGVTTAVDSSAYLGIESEGDVTGTGLKGNGDPLRIGTLSNNVISDIEVVGATGESYRITYTDTDGRQDGDTFEIT